MKQFFVIIFLGSFFIFGVNSIGAETIAPAKKNKATEQAAKDNKKCFFENAEAIDWLKEHKDHIQKEYQEYRANTQAAFDTLLPRLESHNQFVDHVRASFKPISADSLDKLRDIKLKFANAESEAEKKYWQKKFFEILQPQRLNNSDPQIDLMKILDDAKKHAESPEFTEADFRHADMEKGKKNKSGNNLSAAAEFILSGENAWARSYNALWLHQNATALGNSALAFLPKSHKCASNSIYTRRTAARGVKDSTGELFSNLIISCDKGPSLEIYSGHILATSKETLNSEPLMNHLQVRTITRDTYGKISTAISPKTHLRTTMWSDAFGKANRTGKIMTLPTYIKEKYLASSPCQQKSWKEIPESPANPSEEADIDAEIKRLESAL